MALGWLAACRSDAAQSPPARPDTTKRRDSILADTVKPVAAKPFADSTTPRRKPADSAIHLVLSTRLPSRGQNDSISLVAAIRKGLGHPGWPVRGPAPLPGSILPARRIVAFYGNPLSPRMGILGELAPPQMLARFDSVLAEWRAADPSTSVQPALHLISVVAQETPGRDGRYRLRMDSTLIAKVYAWAQARHAMLILDVQAGQSTVRDELPRLLPWLAKPDVHLALDPEFYMHYNREGKKPGTRIGTMDAADVNYAIEELGKLVTQYSLPPKVLIIHRFTQSMLRNAALVHLDPRVQLVINMDGWGQPWLKFDTYAFSEIAEPVQYTGFKLFFHHDTRKGDLLLTPREVLALRPRPMYIQYQ
jgi:hypothetical protein